MSYEIRSGVPMPNRRCKVDLPFRELAPGQMFFVPARPGQDQHSGASSVCTARTRAQNQLPGRKFIVRSLTEAKARELGVGTTQGWGVWRTDGVLEGQAPQEAPQEAAQVARRSPVGAAAGKGAPTTQAPARPPAVAEKRRSVATAGAFPHLKDRRKDYSPPPAS